MIPSIIILGIALYWLLRETDYLRIRLLVGPDIMIPEPERLDWDTIKSRLGNIKKTDVYWLRFPEYMEPLCGWDWLKNTKHIIPETRLEVAYGGVRYNMNIKDCTIIKDIVTAMKAKPHNGNGQLHFTRNKLGGLVAPLPAKAS